jgi:hypothetical protein
VASTTSIVNFTVSRVLPTATAIPTAQNLIVGVPLQGYYPLRAVGGYPPYSYSITSGTLPSGITYASGVVAGTALANYATAAIVFAVQDASAVVPATSGSSSSTSTVNFTVGTQGISVIANSTPQTLTSNVAMTSFNPLTASGGAAPYTYSYSGTLPTGLIFNALTGAITGTPTVPGPYTATFTVKDSYNVVANATSTVIFTVQ